MTDILARRVAILLFNLFLAGPWSGGSGDEHLSALLAYSKSLRKEGSQGVFINDINHLQNHFT
jgi:hypothetical protein